MSLVPQVTLQEFDKWDVDFVGPINPLGKRTGACYIITTTYCLTRWGEAAPVRYCIAATVAIFLFDHVMTRFGCPKFLISDKGTHFLNQLIEKITKEFQS